jgi:hypothetical protein
MIGATLTTRLAQYGINLLPLYRAVASSARGSHRNFSPIYSRVNRRRCLRFVYWRSRASRKSGKSVPI